MILFDQHPRKSSKTPSNTPQQNSNRSRIENAQRGLEFSASPVTKSSLSKQLDIGEQLLRTTWKGSSIDDAPPFERIGPLTFAYFFLFGGRVADTGNKRSSKKHEVSDISIQWREKYGTSCEISGDGPCLITKPGRARCWKNHAFIVRSPRVQLSLLLESSAEICSQPVTEKYTIFRKPWIFALFNAPTLSGRLMQFKWYYWPISLWQSSYVDPLL